MERGAIGDDRFWFEVGLLVPGWLVRSNFDFESMMVGGCSSRDVWAMGGSGRSSEMIGEVHRRRARARARLVLGLVSLLWVWKGRARVDICFARSRLMIFLG